MVPGKDCVIRKPCYLVETPFLLSIFLQYIPIDHKNYTIHLPFYFFYRQIKLTIYCGGNTFSHFNLLAFLTSILGWQREKKGPNFNESRVVKEKRVPHFNESRVAKGKKGAKY